MKPEDSEPGVSVVFLAMMPFLGPLLLMAGIGTAAAVFLVASAFGWLP